MPELPDLQVFSHNLHKRLASKTLQDIKIYRSQKVGEDQIKQAVTGAKLEKFYREGKELRLKFDNDQILGMHLRLHGKLFVYQDEHKENNTIADLYFTDKTRLTLTDFQGIATIDLNPAEKKSPDALDDEMNAAYLESKLSKTRIIIKTMLLDQDIIRGIGNAYADEILWDARISPLSKSNKIPEVKIAELVDSIKSVLIQAEKHIMQSYPNLINGEVRDFLKVHNSKKTESPTGAKIEVGTVGSKKTYYTSEQELYV